MLLRGACGGGRWTQETQLARACRTGRDVRAPLSLSTRIHARPGTGEQQQQRLGCRCKVTRLRWGGARMHECSAARDATPPIQAMQAGPPGPTFAGQSAKSERACRSIPARNLFCVPGVHLNPSHTRLVHMCGVRLVECCRPCLPADNISLSTAVRLCCVSAFHRSQPSPSPYLACLPSFLKRWQHSVIASR